MHRLIYSKFHLIHGGRHFNLAFMYVTKMGGENDTIVLLLGNVSDYDNVNALHNS